ncbi:hypothetical protein O988_09779, partial [Pseudogymnoascus sp. VKM F-3808]
MPPRPAASGVGEKKVVVIELEKMEGTYLELGFWDDDIGAERYDELLQEGRIRELSSLDFDGNLLRLEGQPDRAISLKNSTIFRCYCAPDLQNCRACFMRKRTQFAEGRAQLARVGRREAKIRTRRFKAKAESLEAEVAALESTVDTLESTLTERDAELRASKAQVLALKDYIAAQFADRVHALGAAHPLAEFQRAADVFASKGGKVGRSVQPGDASGHLAEHAPTTEHDAGNNHTGGLGGGVKRSGSPDGAGESTDSDDEDFHIGLARKRRRTSSAGLDRP